MKKLTLALLLTLLAACTSPHKTRGPITLDPESKKQEDAINNYKIIEKKIDDIPKIISAVKKTLK